MNRPTIAVDFDGVLHSYTTPWVDAETIPDPPIPGAIAWLRQMGEHFNIVIYTTRGRMPEGQRAVRHWLHENGLDEGMNCVVTAEKPPALVYIDDRAWRFEGRFPTKDEIDRARPWKIGQDKIASEGMADASWTRHRNVRVAKLEDDPVCLRASLGGTRADGFYLTYRGPEDQIKHLLESALQAFNDRLTSGSRKPIPPEETAR